MENVAPIELAWTVIAAVGFTFSILNMYEARRDLKAAAARRNGVTEVAIHTAKLTFRTEFIRTIQEACLVGVGIFAMTLPQPPPLPDEEARMVYRLVIVLLLFLFSIGITTNTIIMFVGRRRILAMLGVHHGIKHREKK